VVADGRRIRDYVVIQVEDRGLGMTDEQLDLLNQRLAEPPSVDVAAFRLMGLAVVGRLADRYGIRVELRANMEGGTVAQVILPSSIVVLPNRPVESRAGRIPQLDSGPAGVWDALQSARNATATLPYSVGPSSMRPEQTPAWRAELSGPQHPSLPMMPSQRPRPDALPPAVDRPLPTRVAYPAAQATPVTDGSAASAMGSPTMAYPTLTQAPSPELQVAVGFVTPDGRKILPPPLPVSPNPSGWGAALAAMPAPPPPPVPALAEERADAPIFLQMQASWFKTHEGVGPGEWTLPTAGYAPPPVAAESPAAAGPSMAPASAVATAAGPPPLPPRRVPQRIPASAEAVPVSGSGQNGPRPASAGRDSGGPGGGTSVPRQRASAEDHWRTRADEGWQRAMAAAEPPDAGTTRSGLPKRVPQAQLVPGGVEGGARNQKRRSPDEVRGLLSAYHRGVQRGRTAGSAEAAADAPAPKEN